MRVSQLGYGEVHEDAEKEEKVQLAVIPASNGTQFAPNGQIVTDRQTRLQNGQLRRLQLASSWPRKRRKLPG